MIWTEQQVEELEAHWASGLSCSAIGRRMGVTRNTIIGKAHRLGLESRAQRFDPEERQRRKDEQEQRAEARRQRHKDTEAARRERQRNQRSRKVQAPTLPEPGPAFSGSLNIPFGDLREFSRWKPNQCRYIADEPAGPAYLACGNETLSGESWCGHCRGIVFTRELTITDADRERRQAQARRVGIRPQIVVLAGDELNVEDEAA